jgi:hypothetical protein
MTLYGGGEPCSCSVVRNELLISGSSLRSCGNKVVSIPSEADQSFHPQQDDRCACVRGPSVVLDNTHGRIPVEYGYNGRKRSQREASKELHFRTQSELYDMAFGPGNKLQVCAPRFEGIGCQHCQLRLELFPKFSQPEISTAKSCVGSFLRFESWRHAYCEDRLYIRSGRATNPTYISKLLLTEIRKRYFCRTIDGQTNASRTHFQSLTPDIHCRYSPRLCQARLSRSLQL